MIGVREEILLHLWLIYCVCKTVTKDSTSALSSTSALNHFKRFKSVTFLPHCVSFYLVLVRLNSHNFPQNPKHCLNTYPSRDFQMNTNLIVYIYGSYSRWKSQKKDLDVSGDNIKMDLRQIEWSGMDWI
jgi:hypothetical protein